jgi:hypothetical protein
MADGESLRSICRDPKMPSRNAVRNWLLAHESFRIKYVQAAEDRADAIFDEMFEIADTTQLGTKTVTKKTGVEIIEGDMVEHRKLQIYTRQWALGKMRPKKYGDVKEGDGTPSQITHRIIGGLPDPKDMPAD